MHKVVKVAGGLSALIGGALTLGSFNIAEDTGLGALVLITSGLSLLLSGAILYCFGAIVEHLRAIQENTERQLKIFEDRMQKAAK